MLRFEPIGVIETAHTDPRTPVLDLKPWFADCDRPGDDVRA